MTVVGSRLHEIEYQSSVASAQVKSAILLAAVLARVRVRLSEPHLSRDHTERMLSARGVVLRRHAAPDQEGVVVELPPAQVIGPLDVRVPGDPSSAAYFVALALMASAGELALEKVCLNETRTGFLDALRRMGAHIAIVEKAEEGGETVGTVVARPSPLSGIEVSASDVPSMIDELPLLACMATRARGQTIVRGASELRVKESDRITSVVENLRRLGCDAEELADGFRIAGGSPPLKGRVRTEGDHRIAMAFGVLGSLPGNEIEVDDIDCVAVSYPRFWSDMASVRQ
jgi:3-phosphoshikimate 1-carboxyvinyltransferase